MKFKTLHEAIVYVLQKNLKPVSFEEIARAIKKEQLWRRPSDNSFPEAFQIRLRTVVRATYKNRFVQEAEKKIRLR